MYTININIRGNSPAAIAGRAARLVRQANAWKVKAGLLKPAELRQWARRVEVEAKADPEAFADWAGVVRRA